MFIPALASGYGYMGDLPKLGKKTKPEPPEQLNIEKNAPEFKPPSIVIPRPTIGHKIDNYSSYLADIKEVYGLLKDIKQLLSEKNEDKIQLFCAKVKVLNLYVNTIEKKYGKKPERYYETYKQLIVLDKYLTEIVDYKKGMDRYKLLNTGTLENKLKDKQHLERKIKKAIIPITTVIEIMDETG